MSRRIDSQCLRLQIVLDDMTSWAVAACLSETSDPHFLCLRVQHAIREGVFGRAEDDCNFCEDASNEMHEVVAPVKSVCCKSQIGYLCVEEWL